MENKEFEEIVEVEVTDEEIEREERDPQDEQDHGSSRPTHRKRRRHSEFAWESFDSVQNSRKNQLIDDIYNMNDSDEARLNSIREEWATLGNEGDDAALEERFNRAVDNQLNRAEKMKEAAQKKKALVDEAQLLRDSSDWKKAAQRLKDLQKDWKNAGFAGSALNDSLWEKFTAINDAFFERRHEHYQELDEKRQEAKAVKDRLIEEALRLQDSDQWKETSARLREMMNEWKKVGTAGRDIDDDLWKVFNDARQVFYKRQDEHFDAINQNQEVAAAAKQKLIEEARRLASHYDLNSVKGEMDSLMDQWKASGYSGRNLDQNLWKQFNEIRNQFYLDLREAKSTFRETRKLELDDEINALEAKLDTLEDLSETLANKLSSVESKPEPGEGNPERESILAAKQEEIDELNRLIDDNVSRIEENEANLAKLQDEWERLN